MFPSPFKLFSFLYLNFYNYLLMNRLVIQPSRYNVYPNERFLRTCQYYLVITNFSEQLLGNHCSDWVKSGHDYTGLQKKIGKLF